MLLDGIPERPAQFIGNGDWLFRSCTHLGTSPIERSSGELLFHRYAAKNLRTCASACHGKTEVAGHDS